MLARPLTPGAGEVKNGRDQKDQEDDRLELTRQIGIGPRPDRPADRAHLVGPLVGTEHLTDQHPGIAQPRDRHAQHDPERHAFERLVIGILHEGEILKIPASRPDRFRRVGRDGCRRLGQQAPGTAQSGKSHRHNRKSAPTSHVSPPYPWCPGGKRNTRRRQWPRRAPAPRRPPGRSKSLLPRRVEPDSRPVTPQD
jgi:hypothetical protein